MDSEEKQERQVENESSQLYEIYTGPSITARESLTQIQPPPRTRYQIEEYIGQGRYKIRVEFLPD